MSLLEVRYLKDGVEKIVRLNERDTLNLMDELHAFSSDTPHLLALRESGAYALRLAADYRADHRANASHWVPVETFLRLARWQADDHVVCPLCEEHATDVGRNGKALPCEGCNERELADRAAFERAHSAEVLG